MTSNPLSQKEFSSLCRGDFVRVSQLGICKVLEQYPDNQLIAQFGRRKIRIRFGDRELYNQPVVIPPSQKKITIRAEGKPVSMRQYKKRQKEHILTNYIPIKKAKGILGLSEKKFRDLLARHDVAVTTLGIVEYINIEEFKKLI